MAPARATTNQPRQSDLWIKACTGLVGILLSIGGWFASSVTSKLDVINEKVTQGREDNRVLAGKVETLGKDIEALKAKSAARDQQVNGIQQDITKLQAQQAVMTATTPPGRGSRP